MPNKWGIIYEVSWRHPDIVVLSLITVEFVYTYLHLHIQ